MKLGIKKVVKLAKPIVFPILKNVFKSVANGIVKSENLRDYILLKPQVKSIAPDVYRITELFAFNSYLFIGKERALLVDTGIGLKTLKDQVEKLTDKPLIVAATHSHIPAIGGAGEFPEVMIHKDDLKQAKKISEHLYKGVLLRILPKNESFRLNRNKFKDKAGNFVPLDLSEEIDLGGKKIKIIHTPSHTRGSCCFIDKKDKLVITGHVTTPILLMLDTNATTMEDCKNSFEMLQKELKDRSNYGGCGLVPLSEKRTEDLKQLIDDSVEVGNNYENIFKMRSSLDRKRALIYFPAKTVKHNKRERFKALFKKPEKIVY